MSFIYAEKNNMTLTIHSDTRLNTLKCTKVNISEDQKNLVDKYGVVKSSIICPEFCISYAGDIFQAAKLFRQLSDIKVFCRQDVIDIAYDIHCKSLSNSGVDFIISSYEDNKLRIDCIKDHNKDLDWPFAWIGSYDSFMYFREISMTGNEREKGTSWLFEKTLNRTKDLTVGKFHIITAFDLQTKRFQYQWSYQSFVERERIFLPGENIRLFDDSSDGGYTIEIIPCNIENVIIEFKQIKRGVLFSRQFRMQKEDVENEQLFGLMLPMLVKKDEENGWKRYL